MMLAAPVFWGSVAFVAYAYVGYPLLAWTLGRFSRRPSPAGAGTPSITVVIAAHNEEARVGTKIENCLGLDYPDLLLDVIVVSDGSIDRTAAVVRSMATIGEAAAGGGEARAEIPISSDWRRENLKIVAFVQARKGRVVLASAAVPLAPPAR